jgi:osmotically-inducible protein OsmY
MDCIMLTARRLGLLFGATMLFGLTGCDINIPIFHEDPTTISEDRSELAKQEDDRIRGDILSAFVEQDVGSLKNVTVDVYANNVLLTGTVVTPEAKETAGSVAASAENVGKIINEIQILEDSSLRDKAEDLSIENRLKASLRESTKINSFNLRWHSVNGVAYLFGRAKSKNERDRALGIARSVKGVKDVVDHIEVRGPEGTQSWVDNLL